MEDWTGFAGLMLTVLISALAGFGYIFNIQKARAEKIGTLNEATGEKIGTLNEAVNERILTTRESLDVKIEAVEKTACLHADAIGEREAKARHDLSNRVMAQYAEMRNDNRTAFSKLEERQSRTEAEMVRKPDLRDLEARITASIDKAITQFVHETDKIEQSMEKKFDMVCERLNRAERHG